jgi:hypothetical protein
MSSTKEQLVGNIKEWIQADNEIKELQKQIKIRKDKKKKLTDNLVNTMKSNEIDCFDVKDGQLIYTQNKTKSALNKKTLLTSLEKYFSNSGEQQIVQDLCQFILENREIKVTETIRRKQQKNVND